MDETPTPSEEATRVTDAGAVITAPPDPFAPPARVGRYMVIEELGRGGMGVVLRAYDPRLQREVALKMLVGLRTSEAAQARMVREARAMARVSHPNVVAVFDVETIEGDVVLAMALVEGQPLSRWLRGEHGWEEIVGMFAAAGRGLVAAHAEGLLHRDFKPANVIVGRDDRPQVTDFGLARSALTSEAEPSVERASATMPEASVDTSLTMDGTVVGTPGYMAPECHMGQELTPAVDQYAFCVALWSALTGSMPFPQKKLEELARAKLQGSPSWSGPSRVPGRVVEALRRGLRPRPGDRWPSMDALLAELEPPSPRQGLGWLMGGLGALVVGSGIWLAAREPARCTGAEDAIAEVWNEARRTEVHEALAAAPRSYAPRVAQWTVDRLDGLTATWVEGHQDACEASTIRGEQSSATMDLRMACLARVRRELGTASELLVDGSEAMVDRAEAIVEGLGAPQRCADLTALAAEVPMPEDPSVAELVERQRDTLAGIDVRLHAADYDRAEAELVAVEDETREVSYPPLHTEVRLRRARLEEERGHFDESVAAYRDALREGLRWGQWREAWRAATQLSMVMGFRQERHDAGLAHVDVAKGLLSRLGEDSRLEESSTRTHHGQVLLAMRRLDEAESEQRRALELYREVKGPEHAGQAHLLNNLATVLQVQGRYEDAETMLRQAMSMWAAEFSPDYPEATATQVNLGVLLKSRGRYEDAEEELVAALEAYERTLGPEHPRMISVLHNLANVLRAQGRYDEAEARLRRAIDLATLHHGSDHVTTATSRAALALVLKARGRNEEAEAELRQAIVHITADVGAEHPRVLNLRGNLANVLKNLKRFDEAEAEFREVLTLERIAFGPRHPSVAGTVHNLANLLTLAERTDEAIPLWEEAVAMREELLGPSHRLLAMSLAGLGSARMDQGRLDEAVTALGKAWTIVEAGGGPRDRARVAFNLGRARWEQGADRDGALALVRSAHELFVDDAGPEHAETLEVVRWLAEHE